MASGKTHRRFNLLLIPAFTFILFYYDLHYFLIVTFFLGYLSSTYLFSPDTDLLPSKYLSLVRPLFYPYTILFKHRGSSHNLIWGTLGRIIYLILLTFLITFLLNKVRLIDFNVTSFIDFIFNFSLNNIIYISIIWFFLGLYSGDFFHIFLDKIKIF